MLLRLQDAGVVGAAGGVADQQFFVQLFTGAQAGDLDVDAARGLQGVAHALAGQLDHAARQVVDAHRLAHVQHEYLAAVRHGASLDHQLRGFGDGHEVARDVAVRDGDRAALVDLAPEQRHDRARGAQHVAKAHHGVAGAVGAWPGVLLVVQCLQHHFGQALAGAHDVGGAHRLVGADQHELPDAVARGGTRAHQGAPDVVVQAFERVVLDQRHVLVGGSVVDDVRPPGRQDGVQARGVLHRAEQGHDLHRRPLGLLGDGGGQFAVNFIERVLTLLQQQQHARLPLQDLAAKLAADGAAGARDHHRPGAQVACEQGLVRLDRVAAQQVFDVQVVQVAGVHAAPHQVGHAGQGAHVHRMGAQQFDDLLAALHAGRGNGQQHRADAVFAHQLAQFGRGTHGQAVQPAALQGRAVVQIAHQPLVGHAHQAGGQLHARLAGAIDQHARGIDPGQQFAVQVAHPQPHGNPAQTQGHEHEQRLDDAHRARDAGHTDHGEHQRIQQAVDRGGLAQCQHGVPAGMAED